MLLRPIKWFAWPAMVGGAVALVLWACRRGIPLPLVAVGLTLLTVFAIIFLEHLIPYSDRWSTFRKDERVDPLHFLFSERAYDVGALLSLLAFASLGDFIHGLGITIWPRGAPFAVQATLAILLSDVSLYWGHRLGHRVPFLWRLHAIHHTTPRLHWFSVWRSHPLDNVLRAAANVAPLALCGIPAEVMAIVAAFSGTIVILSHCNADLKTGPFDLFFNTPTVHRWHHSRRPEESNANYAVALTLWDHAFGTRNIPRHCAPPEDVGLAEDLASAPLGFLAQMRAPFQSELWPREPELTKD